MNFELFVALRYLLAKRRQAFISVISLISILGVTVGVMALLIALALMTGLQGELRDRIVGSSAHVYVFKVGEGIRDVPGEIAKMKQLPRRCTSFRNWSPRAAYSRTSRCACAVSTRTGCKKFRPRQKLVSLNGMTAMFVPD